MNTVSNGNGSVDQRGALQDVNGDGLPDLLSYLYLDASDENFLVYYNVGDGFSTVGMPLVPLPALSRSIVATNADSSVFYHATILGSSDYDGDGRVDWYVQNISPYTEPHIFWNQLGGMSEPQSFPLVATLIPQTRASDYDWHTHTAPIDVDGDGRVDNLGTGASAPTGPQDGTRRAVMRQISNGRGLTTSIAYAPHTDTSVVRQDNGRIPSSRWVVREVVSVDAHNDLGADQERVSYEYANPVWNQDPDGKWGFRGFESVTTTAPSGALAVTEYEYELDWSGREVGSTTFADADSRDADRPRTVRDTRWHRYLLFEGRVSSYHSLVEKTWACNPGQSSSECRAVAPAYQNWRWRVGLTATGEKRYAWLTYEDQDPAVLHVQTGEQHSSHSTSNDGDWTNGFSYEIHCDTTNYRVNLFGEATTVRTPEGKFFRRIIRHRYDDAGLVEERTQVNHETGYATLSEYTYDATGQVRTIKKPNQVKAGSDAATSLEYDPYSLFVTATTNELGHVVNQEWDYGTGQVVRTTGPNPSEEAISEIDGFGRVTELSVNIDGVLTTVAEITYADDESPLRVSRTSHVSAGTTRENHNFYDGHGRLLETRTPSSVDGVDAVTRYHYDASGKMVAVDVPDPSQNGDAQVTFHYGFDTFGRPTTLRNPLGNGLNIHYSGLVQTHAECADVEGMCDEEALGEVLASKRTGLRCVRPSR